MIPAAIYLRAASPAKAERLEQRLRAYAKAERLEVTAVFSDELAGHLKSSPGLERYTIGGLAWLVGSARRFRWVVTADAGLLAEIADELEAAGVRVAVEGQALGLARTRKKAAKRSGRNKARERLSVSQRLLRGREEGARRGLHQSGPAPYGYVRDYTERKAKGVRLKLHPDEAPIVRAIFRLYLKRRSIQRVIQSLEAEGLLTRRSRRWSRAGVAWILRNETYLGRVHFGKIRARGQHPALISPIVFNKAAKLMRKNNKRGGKGAT